MKKKLNPVMTNVNNQTNINKRNNYLSSLNLTKDHDIWHCKSISRLFSTVLGITHLISGFDCYLFIHLIPAGVLDAMNLMTL